MPDVAASVLARLKNKANESGSLGTKCVSIRPFYLLRKLQ